MATTSPSVTALSLVDFRNYAKLDLQLDKRPVVLNGANGSGKTNLLEAVSFLSPGRGLRRARLDQVARHGGPGGWSISCLLDDDEFQNRIGTGYLAGEETAARAASRVVRVNGANAKSNEQLLDYCRVIWITPAQDSLFTGSASDRRRFLDRLVLAADPTHAGRVKAYERALSSRNRVLETNARDTVWLDGLEQQIAELACAIAFARHDLVQRLQSRIADAESGVFPTAELSLESDFDQKVGEENTAVELEKWIVSNLKSGRHRDAAAGRALFGPHRSDLQVSHREKAIPASQASTGEQKALLIGLILAHTQIVLETDRRSPILLLDEVVAHLDSNRRDALFAQLISLGCQAWMTGTEPIFFEALSDHAQWLNVDSGTISPGR